MTPSALSPEQAAEFPTPALAEFALAYLVFLHSSPCTSKRRTFPYFAAPADTGMSDDDVLFGPDREDAYKRLMWSFRKCQRARELDRYFDAAHNQYWESASIPGLVLLKEWASEQPTLPGVYTGRIGSIKPEAWDEVWICVRSLKAMPHNPLGNIRHVPLLSPSTGLWHHYLDLKKAGRWDEAAFKNDFSVKFLKEMLAPEPYAKLKELSDLTRTKAILVACYCPGEICHRVLVKQLADVMRGQASTDGKGADDDKKEDQN